jgi:hypothetical protein
MAKCKPYDYMQREMSSGGYRFKDYWRMGLPLTIYRFSIGGSPPPMVLAPLSLRNS